MPTVTYSPEDNKIRLYVGWVPRDEYETLRAAGFVATPKQNCDFSATWTPAREDLAREYLEDNEDIGDEDYSPAERAADRAERFGGYRDKRAAEAGAAADVFEAGAEAFGSQSLARAERQARRHDRHRVFAVSQWSKAEYWQQRTAGVIANALYKSSPHVRRGRILTLEAEQRKQLASIEQSQIRYNAWHRLATMEGADELLPLNEDGYVSGDMTPAQQLAYTLANHGNCWASFWHPTCEAANEKLREVHKITGAGLSPYDLLTKTDYIGTQFDRLTPRQVAQLYIEKYRNPSEPGTHSQRWARHYELRLEYEKAMLANEGGMAGESDIEVGGWIRGVDTATWLRCLPAVTWHQIQGISRSPKTKRATSVKLNGYTRSAIDENNGKPVLVSVNIERLGEGCYRAPTDEERAAFSITIKKAKAEAKATKPKTATLINPTPEDAERLMAIWNSQAKQEHAKAVRQLKTFGEYEPSSVFYLTQEQYTASSQGTYSRLETRTLYDCGRISRRNSNLYTSAREAYDNSLGQWVCKVRTHYSNGTSWYSPQCLVVITDKPQKPLPLNWAVVETSTPELVEA